jgi:ribosomal protein L37AE/L43A
MFGLFLPSGTMSDTTERQRDCCPKCLSIDIDMRKKCGNYHCRRCGALFVSPSTIIKKKKYALPRYLVNILQKKQEEKLCDGDIGAR